MAADALLTGVDPEQAFVELQSAEAIDLRE